MSSVLFGTDGVRGVPGTPPLDAVTIACLGAALAEELGGAPRIACGRDTRDSGRLGRAVVRDRGAGARRAAGRHRNRAHAGGSPSSRRVTGSMPASPSPHPTIGIRTTGSRSCWPAARRPRSIWSAASRHGLQAPGREARRRPIPGSLSTRRICWRPTSITCSASWRVRMSRARRSASTAPTARPAASRPGCWSGWAFPSSSCTRRRMAGTSTRTVVRRIRRGCVRRSSSTGAGSASRSMATVIGSSWWTAAAVSWTATACSSWRPGICIARDAWRPAASWRQS